MLSKPTTLRPSPTFTCSTTGLCHNPIHLRLGRVGFRPRFDPYSCRLSRVNRTISVSKEIVINTPRQVSEVLEGLSCEEDKKKMNNFLEDLLKEKQDSFGGFSEKEFEKFKDFAESLMREENKKIHQLLDGMSEQGLKNMNDLADCMSKDEMKKLRVIIKGLTEEEINKVTKFADDLTEEENKNFIEVLNVTSEAERKLLMGFVKSFLLKEEKVIISDAVLFCKDLMSKNKFEDQIDVLRRFGFIKEISCKQIISLH